MTNSFSIGLSGLRANSTAVETAGNNLANISTTGFKAASVLFRDMIAAPGVAAGTAQPVTMRQFNQGGIQSSSGLLDAAILGDGFFVMKGSDNERLYGRAGSFQVDSSGRLTTASGESIQGWNATNGLINTTAAIGDLTIPFGTVQAGTPTGTLALDLNLDASAMVGAASGKFSTSAEVYDSLGGSHPVTFTFAKTGTNAWSYAVTMPGEQFTDGTAGTPQEIATGDLEFDASGVLTSPSAEDGAVELSIAGLANGAADLTINWSLFREDLTASVRQTSQASGSFGVKQDGTGAGQLTSVSMGDGGLLQARFSNGDLVNVGQVAIAKFQNPSSLVTAGSNAFRVGPATSDPSIGIPDTGGRGKVIGRSLEASTVDLAQEFTNLIVYQRGYQANSRVITTADELAQETLNLKR